MALRPGVPGRRRPTTLTRGAAPPPAHPRHGASLRGCLRSPELGASGGWAWGTLVTVQRVVILGPGGGGKSTFAAQLAETSGLPLVELDPIFWGVGSAVSPSEWTALQEDLVSRDTWVLDGDLGQYDVVEPRLRAADTIIVLDFPAGGADGGRFGAHESDSTSGVGCGGGAGTIGRHCWPRLPHPRAMPRFTGRADRGLSTDSRTR